MDKLLDGIILKGTGGFYYVEVAEKVYECKARGIFRKQGIKPLAGDYVTILREDTSNTIEKIHKRTSCLVRPQVANIDQLVIVTSTCDPRPNILNIDKMTAFAYYNRVEPVIIITKNDLSDGSEIKNIYDQSGIKSIMFSSTTKEGANEIKELLSNKITALAGNTGVGKSTLLNAIYDDFRLETGKTSKKLGRGKHTTRTVELFKLPEGGYVADSPGFSTIDISKYGIVDKNKIITLFPDLHKHAQDCKFISCTHTCEKGCSLIKALKDGKVANSRFNSYVTMYNEIKDIKEWDIKKGR